MFIKSKNTTVANNRNQKRVIRNDITVAFQAKVGKKTFPFFVELLNISPQGMAFRCNKSFRVSTPLNLEFSFSDGRKFFMKGNVAHKILETESGKLEIQRSFNKMFESNSTVFQYGIKFEKVDDDFQTTFIKTMLQNMRNAKKQYIAMGPETDHENFSDNEIALLIDCYFGLQAPE